MKKTIVVLLQLIMALLCLWLFLNGMLQGINALVSFALASCSLYLLNSAYQFRKGTREGEILAITNMVAFIVVGLMGFIVIDFRFSAAFGLLICLVVVSGAALGLLIHERSA